MKHISSFETFLFESKGISRPIYGILKNYFDQNGEDANYQDAKEVVAQEADGWDLSKEDFEEAKDKFLS